MILKEIKYNYCISQQFVCFTKPIINLFSNWRCSLVNCLCSDRKIFFLKIIYINFLIGQDKSGYQVDIILISLQKHMLWVLIRSASARRF